MRATLARTDLGDDLIAMVVYTGEAHPPKLLAVSAMAQGGGRSSLRDLGRTNASAPTQNQNLPHTNLECSPGAIAPGWRANARHAKAC